MAHDEKLASRLRRLLESTPDVTERKMFGGLVFMLRGHMLVGIVDRNLMVRVGPEQYVHALSQRHAKPMDFTGRPSRGMVYVQPGGVRDAAALKKWIALAESFVRSLPAKAGPATSRAQRPRAARGRRPRSGRLGP